MITATENEWNAELAVLSAEDRIRWAIDRFGEGLVLTTSFGIQSALMLELATRVKRDIPVVFIDTGYLFGETYRFAEQLTRRLELNLKVYRAVRSPAWQEAVDGKRWEAGVDGLAAYNRENKVEPMARALRELGATAWLSGLRRGQSSTRQHLDVVQKQNRTWKIHPVIDWTEKQVFYYLQDRDLPLHPLWEAGYATVGDWHSSAPLGIGQTAEDTRFGGLKRECGLHEVSGNTDWQI
jgi:phosphoadenosine phosphosulfate reductase